MNPHFPVQNHADPSPQGGLRFTILLLFFLSGACGLIYEVAWMRMLTLVFGATAFATSTILASFFTGLALGGAYFGRVVDRSRRPLLIYALLEAGVALFAFLMPFLLAGVTAIYVAVSRQFDIGFYGISLIRFALSFLVLVLPAILMGGTLPVIVKFFVEKGRRESLGWHVGRLYSLNTFGAVVGTLSAGFFLILFLGVREATYLAGALNLLIAAVAFLLHRRAGPLPETAQGLDGEFPTEESQPTAPAPGGPSLPHAPALTLWAIGLSGFCALGYEVFWTRGLVFFLDNSTHAFTTILTAFLLGIALGSLVIAPFVDRGKRLLGWLGLTEILIGVFAVLAIPILNHSTPVFERMADASVDAMLPWKWMGLRFVNSLSVMLLPTLFMGMAFPLAGKLYAREVKRVGTALGDLYAVNTIGGVLGSLLAGFALIPLIGVQNGILLMAAVNILIGGVLIFYEPSLGPRVRLAAIGGLSLVVLGFGAVYVQKGAVPLTSHYERLETERILSYEEGIGGTVKVYEDIYGDRIISINGFPVAGTPLEYHDAQKALAHFPLLLSPVSSPRVGIVGFGAGGTSWGSLQHPVEAVDCVELVPAVPRAAFWFPDVNHGVLQEPGFNLIMGDGRNHMLVTDREYDVISIDATSPKMAGNGSLYSVDFYELLRERLSGDGLAVQWIPFHLLSDAEVRMTARSFLSVFPHSSLWFTPLRQNVVLMGSREELAIDYAGLEEKFAIPGVREDLEYVNITDPIDFLGNFIMGGEALAGYVGDIPLNTDNHPYLEFTPAMAYFVSDRYRVRNLLSFRENRESVLPRVANMGETEEEAAAVEERIQKRFRAVHYSINGDVLLFLHQRDQAIMEYEEALSLDPTEKNWLNAIWRYGDPRR
ncbi:MAG: fused MFS/spermidine synthase [Longimicrobiales bacterium]